MAKTRDIERNIVEGIDDYFGYNHFCASNMADYTLMSATISDMVAVYGISETEAVDIIANLTH